MAWINLAVLAIALLGMYGAYLLSSYSLLNGLLIGAGVFSGAITIYLLLSKIVAQPKILDSSVLIDGRIVDLCKTGFLEGNLIVPDFIINELDLIAGTSDEAKRSRGKRGLDTLTALKRLTAFKLKIIRTSNSKDLPIEKKLLSLIKKKSGVLITNDKSIHKLASLQGMKTLNINELSNALKSVVLPGETLLIKIIKEGKEKGQGVGYLNDGTMVVVEQGQKKLNSQVSVIATSVLQTAAGRMIFAKFESRT